MRTILPGITEGGRETSMSCSLTVLSITKSINKSPSCRHKVARFEKQGTVTADVTNVPATLLACSSTSQIIALCAVKWKGGRGWVCAHEVEKERQRC